MPAEPLKALLVSGPATGGIRRHLLNLLQGLPSERVIPGLAAPSELAGLSESSDGRFWPVELGDRPRPLQDLAALSALRRTVREFRPEVVHAHGVKAALLCLLMPLPGRPPIAVTLHNVWRGGSLTPLLRRLLPRAKAIICVSDAVRTALAELGITVEHASVIPNGISLPDLARREIGNQVTVAYVGRLTQEKGIDLLIEAWKSVIASKSLNGSGKLRLVIAGDGPLRREVERWAGSMGSDATFLGHVEAVSEVYENADLVVIPSRSEGQSLTALEAMSHGLPVVATAVGGLREVVVDGVTGVLVPPESPKALVNALSGLARDPAMQARLGHAGRARVEQLFSLDRMLERTAAVYRECARRT